MLSLDPPPPFAPDEASACAACGASLAGRFCAACGERRPSPEDERLGPFLREQWHEATAADGKLWATLKGLFVPGKLTEEYFAGRRGRYVRPVRIFLVANVAFFLTLSAMGANSIFQGRASTQRTATWYGSWATEQLAAAAEREGVEQALYDAAFDQRSTALANSLVGLMVPLFALVTAVALFWRRASGVRHVVFATHFLAFAMAGSIAVAVVLAPVLFAVHAWSLVPPDHWLRYSMDPIIGIVLLVYLTLALRRAFALRWWQTVATVAALAFAGIPLVSAGYRFALFLVALWTTNVPTV